MAEEASWTRSVPDEETDDEIREIYSRVAAARGPNADTAEVAAVWPEFAENQQAQFDLLAGPTRLGADIKDLTAVLVASLNNCRYCGDWYRQALIMRGWSDEKITHILQDIHGEHLDAADQAVLGVAEKLTRRPQAMSVEDIDALRAAGLDDRRILETAALTGYFNYITRLANVLGALRQSGD
jgi:uncharacterized peroxidase-related enzyme